MQTTLGAAGVATLPSSILADKQVAGLLDSLAAAKATLAPITSSRQRGTTGGTPSSSERSGRSAALPSDSGGTGAAERHARIQENAGPLELPRRNVSTPGRLHRIAYTFVGVEGDTSQLSLAAGDLVRVQCHDPSGWTYGRLECASGGGGVNHRIGDSGWFPEALLAVSEQDTEACLEAEANRSRPNEPPALDGSTDAQNAARACAQPPPICAAKVASPPSALKSSGSRGCLGSRSSPSAPARRSPSDSSRRREAPAPCSGLPTHAASRSHRSTTPPASLSRSAATPPPRAPSGTPLRDPKAAWSAEIRTPGAPSRIGGNSDARAVPSQRDQEAEMVVQYAERALAEVEQLMRSRGCMPSEVDEEEPRAATPGADSTRRATSARGSQGAGSTVSRDTQVSSPGRRPVSSKGRGGDSSSVPHISPQRDVNMCSASTHSSDIRPPPRGLASPLGPRATPPRLFGQGSRPRQSPKSVSFTSVRQNTSRSPSPQHPRIGFGRSITPTRQTSIERRLSPSRSIDDLLDASTASSNAGNASFAGFASEEEMVDALEVLKAATLLQAKLAAMPERVREPVRRQLGGLRDLLNGAAPSPAGAHF
mmetsp:Transcript_60187/g.143463  ORF Transcript_60187/g.143463 Transcript_60187/m.143463 type:complete len:596 (-) Transcript_60187:23-1810(-)